MKAGAVQAVGVVGAVYFIPRLFGGIVSKEVGVFGLRGYTIRRRYEREAASVSSALLRVLCEWSWAAAQLRGVYPYQLGFVFAFVYLYGQRVARSVAAVAGMSFGIVSVHLR